MKLQFRGGDGRLLEVAATIQARRGIFATTLDLTGQLVVDKHLHARLTGLKLRGKGVLGKMVASLVRPQLEQFEDQPIILNSLAPGKVDLQDVQFHVTEQLGMTVTLGPSRVVFGKSATNSASPMPEIERLVPHAAALARHDALRGKRLDIYVIDTGWNSRAKRILDDHLRLFEAFLSQQSVYHLSQDQSTQVLKQSPKLMGSDPILMVLDSDGRMHILMDVVGTTPR